MHRELLGLGEQRLRCHDRRPHSVQRLLVLHRLLRLHDCLLRLVRDDIDLRVRKQLRSKCRNLRQLGLVEQRVPRHSGPDPDAVQQLLGSHRLLQLHCGLLPDVLRLVRDDEHVRVRQRSGTGCRNLHKLGLGFQRVPCHRFADPRPIDLRSVDLVR